MVRTETEAAERFLAAPLLAEVDEEARRAVLDVLVEDQAPAGSVLLSQGQKNDRLWFLIGGSARVDRKRPDGRAEVIATLAAPTVVGTTSFFTPNVPTFSVRAVNDVWLLTLSHPDHERLRRDNPHAAEALALAALRVLCERFDELDRLFTASLSQHPDGHPKVTEWAGFRARLFEEPEL
jgi:CRP-like cAMP-binding protein